MTVHFPPKSPQLPLLSSSVCSVCEGFRGTIQTGYLSVCQLQQPKWESVSFQVSKNLNLHIVLKPWMQRIYIETRWGVPFNFGLACRCKDLFVILLNALLERSQDCLSGWWLLQTEGGSSSFKVLHKEKTYSSKLIFNLYLSKIHLQNKHRMFNNGIHIQSPLLQTALSRILLFTLSRERMLGFGLGFFPDFPLQLLKLYENLCYQKRKKLTS